MGILYFVTENYDFSSFLYICKEAKYEIWVVNCLYQIFGKSDNLASNAVGNNKKLAFIWTTVF